MVYWHHTKSIRFYTLINGLHHICILSTTNIQKQGHINILAVHLQLGSLTLALSLRDIRMVGNYLVTDLAVQQILRRKDAMVVTFLVGMLQCATSMTLSSSVAQVGILNFWINKKHNFQ